MVGDSGDVREVTATPKKPAVGSEIRESRFFFVPLQGELARSRLPLGAALPNLSSNGISGLYRHLCGVSAGFAVPYPTGDPVCASAQDR